MNDVINILSALLTPTVAVLGLYIAWQQLQTNRQKLKSDTYERRLNIYKEVRRLFGFIVRDATVSFEDIGKFQVATAEADFLFGKEIPKLLDELRNHANKLRTWTEAYRDNTQFRPENYNHEEVVNGMHAELKWLVEQMEPTRGQFKKYLQLQDDPWITGNAHALITKLSGHRKNDGV